MAALGQRPGKKGRRSDRNSTARTNKTPVRADITSLLPGASEGVLNNPPLAHTLVALIGCVVEVQLITGEVYEGVLRAISPNMEISLNVVHIKGQSPTMDSVYDRKEVKFANVVTISAKTGSNPQLNIFKTDTEISGRTNGPHSRELQPFTDFSDEDANLTIGNNEDAGWSVEEMWAVNQDKFQVSSTYDEELPQYTTPLLRDGENFKQREFEAIQIANEIESKSMYTRHGVDDLGAEEDRWSSVVRESVTRERPQGKMPSPGSGVKENGGHIITTSHLTPPTQAPPTSTPPSLAPPPPTTSSSPLTPPSSHSELSSSETLPPSTPSQSPGSNQTTSSDDIVTDKIIDKTSEGVTPPISSERDVESHTSVGEPSTSEKDHSGVAHDDLQPSAPQSGEGERERKESGASTPSAAGEVAEKEQAIKNFKLDPTAKEFVFSGPPSSPFLSSSTSTASSAPASLQGSQSGVHHMHTHTRAHTHTPRGGTRYTGHHSPRPRTHTPTTAFSHSAAIFPSQEAMLQTAAVSSSYMLTQPGMAGLLRPGIMQQAFHQYAVPPSPMVGGMVAPGVLSNPQIITANPHAQMIATAGGGQQFAVTQPFITQPTQPIFTPHGVISPAAQPTMYVPGVGGVPLTTLQQQMAATAVGMPQVSIGQSMVGTAAASGLPRHYQTGK